VATTVTDEHPPDGGKQPRRLAALTQGIRRWPGTTFAGVVLFTSGTASIIGAVADGDWGTVALVVTVGLLAGSEIKRTVRGSR
jgi:hypothetical protein